MGKKQIQRNLKVFAQRARKTLKAKSVLVFGSVARGQNTQYSDIDVIVLSEVFKHILFEKRLDVLYPLSRDLYPDFHPFGFTVEEFTKGNKFSILSEIKSNSQVIA